MSAPPYSPFSDTAIACTPVNSFLHYEVGYFLHLLHTCVHLSSRCCGQPWDAQKQQCNKPEDDSYTSTEKQWHRTNNKLPNLQEPQFNKISNSKPEDTCKSYNNTEKQRESTGKLPN